MYVVSRCLLTFHFVCFMQVIMRLPDNAEVSNEVWDEVIDCMQRRMQDKVPIVRVYAIRALARFANDVDNANIVNLYKEALSSEQNAVSFLNNLVWQAIDGRTDNVFCQSH